MNKKKNPYYPLIMGRNCLEEVLDHKPETIRKFYINEAILERKTEKLAALLEAIKKERKPIIWTNTKDLTELVGGSTSHQGFVAQIEPRKERALEELIEKSHSQSRIKILALEGIQDPQNMGALLRAAECFKIDALILSKHRNVSLTPTVAKVSMGASELVNIYYVSNLRETCRKLKEEGISIIGTDMSSDSYSIYSYDFPEKSVVIMGSEDKGIGPNLMKEVDDIIHIPMKGDLESLNVSQALGITLAFWDRHLA